MQYLDDAYDETDNGIWVPMATSIANRAAAASARARTPLAALSSRTSGHTIRYSDSEFLAPSLGHYLQLVNAAIRKPIVNKTRLRTRRRVSSSPRRPSLIRLRPPDTTRCDREYRLPLPNDFKWPNISHFAFYEHVGNMRESWRAALGTTDLGTVRQRVGCRSSDSHPSASPGCYHFVGQVGMLPT